MVGGYMPLLKKKKIKKKIVSAPQAVIPLEYERFIKIKCPYCSKGKQLEKQIFIAMPENKLPDTIRCCVCDKVLVTKNLFETGKEIKRR